MEILTEFYGVFIIFSLTASMQCLRSVKLKNQQVMTLSVCNY